MQYAQVSHNSASRASTHQAHEEPPHPSSHVGTVTEGSPSESGTLNRELKRISQEVAYWKKQVLEDDRSVSQRSFGSEDTEDVEFRWLSEGLGRPNFHPGFMGGHQRTESAFSEGSLINMYNHPSLPRSEFSINLVRANLTPARSTRDSFASSQSSSLQRMRGRQQAGAPSAAEGATFRSSLDGLEKPSIDEQRPGRLFIETARIKTSLDEMRLGVRFQSGDEGARGKRGPTDYRQMEVKTRPLHIMTTTSEASPPHVDPESQRILISYNEMVAKMESSHSVNVTDSLASPASDSFHFQDRMDQVNPAAVTSYEYFTQVWAYATSSIWSRSGTAGGGGDKASQILSSTRGSSLFRYGSEGEVRMSFDDVRERGDTPSWMMTRHEEEEDDDVWSLHGGEADSNITLTPTKPPAPNPLPTPSPNPIKPPPFSDLEAILDRLPASRMDDQRCDLSAIMARRRARVGDDAKNEQVVVTVPSASAQPRVVGRIGAGEKDSMLVKVLKRSMGMDFRRK
ncbi:hypothetical protein HDU67_006289 [Dinochytrium kinnereticum]|nr:hypothetical protein HDU67_006289 [Dinochytrium kinnereticum]